MYSQNIPKEQTFVFILYTRYFRYSLVSSA